jgi:hypothetical protein
MEDTRSDYARGLDKGLELALGVINDTADVRFDSVAEVAMYLYNPEQFAHFKKPAKDLGKVPTPA